MSHHSFRAPLVALMCVIGLGATLLFTACGGATGGSSASTTYKPVTLHNCGQTLTFTKPPTRVISTWQMSTDILLKLGLGDRIVGVYSEGAYISYPDNAAQYARLHSLGTTTTPPAKEEALSVNPDFVFSSYPVGDFDAAYGLATRQDFAAIGAQVYGMSGECASDTTKATLNDLYSDILNIGTIFGVEAKAQRIVSDMQSRIAAIAKKVAGLPKAPVIAIPAFAGYPIKSPVSVVGAGIYTSLLAIAGGANLYGDQAQTYPSVSLESVAAKNPAAVVFILYNEGSSLTDFSHQLFTQAPTLTAARKNAVIGIDYPQWNVGVRTPDAIEQLAKALHPEAFQ